MDSQQIFSYNLTSAGLPNMPSFPTIPSLPNRLLESLKFDVGNSPNSPFSTYLDTDTLSALSGNPEQHSSGEILSGVSPSCNSSLETNHYLDRSTSSMDSIKDSLQLYSARGSLLQNANCNQKIQHALLELETALMAPDDEEITRSDTSLADSRGTTTSGQRLYGSWRHEHQGSQYIQSQPSYVTSSRQSGEVGSWLLRATEKGFFKE